MLYGERRRRRVAYQPSLPSSFPAYPGRVSQFSPVEQLPFPDDLLLPPDITPFPQYSFGLIETPIPPASLTGSLYRAGEQQWPAEKVGQMFHPVPKSPTTSFYQPVVIPAVRGKHRTRRRTIATVRLPGPRKRCVMVRLSALCLCLFVVVSVLMIIFPCWW